MNSKEVLPNRYGYEYTIMPVEEHIYEYVMPRFNGESSFVRYLPKPGQSTIKLSDIGGISTPGANNISCNESTIDGERIVLIWEFQERIFMETRYE